MHEIQITHMHLILASNNCSELQKKKCNILNKNVDIKVISHKTLLE